MMAGLAEKRNLVADWCKSLKGDLEKVVVNHIDNRTVVRTRLSKSMTSLKNSLPGTDIFVIQESLKAVLKNKDDLEERDAQIWVNMAQSEAVLEADSDISQSVYFDPVMKLVSLARKRLSELDPKPASGAAASAAAGATGGAATGAATSHPGTPNPSSKVKLPKIALPIFKGQSPSEFKTFWNMFSSLVDSDNSLDSIQKLQYLQSCCQDEAATIAKGYAVTDSNYDELKTALHEMFGLKRLVVQSYMESIIDLPDCNKIGLKSFLNQLETALRSVKEYGIEYLHISPIVIPLVERKLQKEDLAKWKELIFKDDDFSLTKLVKFLHERVQCLPSHSSESSQSGSKQSTQKVRHPQTTSFLAASSSTVYCNVCEMDSHATIVCRKLNKLRPPKRLEIVRTKRLCYKCLDKSSKLHNCTNCRAPNCEKCGKPHATILHLDPKPNLVVTDETSTNAQASTRGTQASQATQASNAEVNTTSVNVARGSSKLLKSLIIEAKQGENSRQLRTLIDSGSDDTWVTSKVREELDLPVIGTRYLAVSTAFSPKYGTPQKFDVVKVDLVTENGSVFTVEALVHEGPIVAPIKGVSFDPKKFYPHLGQIHFADFYPRGPQAIDLLLGTAYEEKIKSGSRRVAQEGPDAVHTIFGWVLSGEMPHEQGETTAINRIAVEDQLKKFWELEEVPNPMKMEGITHEETISNFNKAAKFDEKLNRYVVRIPYTEEVNNLQPNLEQVKRMMKFQQARLAKKPELEQKVKDILARQLDDEIIEEVVEVGKTIGKVHYVPWHTVIREWHETTPIRIVYNLSNKDSNGLSLNSCQTAGPNLLPDTVRLLLKFRSKKVGYTFDIRKMFHQIMIAEDQRDLHRFLAFGKTYRFMSLVMGEKSSPFCAMAVCLLEATKKSDKLPLAYEVIEENLYMDDPISGSEEWEEAAQAVGQLIELFVGIHMKCHKLCSNSQQLLNQFANISLLKADTDVLGIGWNTEEDVLCVKTTPSAAPKTKKELLSKVSSIFDPLGFHSPLTAKGKMLMQKLWKEKCDWNEEIPESIEKEVSQWMESARHGLKVPRYVGSKIQEVNIFCDASEDAYAAVAYVKGQERQEPVLVLSKTKVRPMKVVSMPRMELLAAVLAVRVFCLLSGLVDMSQTFFWTDSVIVLQWIQAQSSHYKTFVSNRISEIQTLSDQRNWRWTPGKENPADLPSRGIWPLNDEEEKLWQHGPAFLQTKEYPVQPTMGKQPELEVKKTAINVTMLQPRERLVDINRFSNLKRLVNTVAFVFRFAHGKKGGRVPEADERKHALHFLIKEDQERTYGKEMHDLRTKNRVAKSSKILSLHPGIQNGILHMQARNQDYTPIILNPNSQLTKLIIEDCHHENLHAGAPTTLTILREKYWITSGLSTVKKITKQCFTCKKANAPLASQQMAPLPSFRVTPSNPFVHTGLDFAGPLLVTRGSHKRYILLFTCGSTRAVHLELTRSMSFKDFNLAFMRFVSRRGKPQKMYSDNAKTFIQAAEEYKQRSINWHFITPRAPWHGAFWERLVKSIKEPLRKTLGKAVLNEVELSTVLCQIEAVINERPLTAILEEDNMKVITPTLLLNGRSLQDVPEEELGFQPTKRLLYLQNLKSQFWASWRRNYLPTLAERPKWRTPVSSTIKKNDIILLLKENTKRHTWPLGRVLETISGRDGLVRSLKILVDGKTVMRPIQHAVQLCQEE